MGKFKKRAGKRERAEKRHWTVPRNFFKRAGIKWTGQFFMELICDHCKECWHAKLSESGVIPEEFLLCPNGCNRTLKENTAKEGD